MTDETRDEIVRLARKGWSIDQISDELTYRARMADEPTTPVTEEQVQAVIDKADAEVERMLTPTVPETPWNENDPLRGQPVPQDNDPIGRIAKWLDDAVHAGYTTEEVIGMLVESTVATHDPSGHRYSSKAILDTAKSQARMMADRLEEMAASDK